ncbi:helix-turn-helix domain-containing protein [Primorskyibacter sp. 2E233]|uniref:helix-turn-helix domain-containing protein n=1 Tax=Primorskyibacter sp. 2E233 TaxID=3413431 RepID=UPI003BF33E70
MKTSRRIFDSETMRGIGAKLREVRGDRTLAEFSKALGLARTTWSNYEAGRRLPSHEVLERLWAVEGIPADQILPSASLKRTVAPQGASGWFSYIPILWLFGHLRTSGRFASENEALLWWSQRVPSLADEFENRAFEMAALHDIDLEDAALLVCQDLEGRSEDELFEFLEGA